VGEFDLEKPEQLLGLLTRMARNRLLNEVKNQQAARRDLRRDEAGAEFEVASPDGTPSQIVANRELLQVVLDHLSPQDRRLAELRLQGREWAEMAAEIGGSPDALRMRLARAVDRVLERLGLD
jgi:RNA polymerase sigma-70 factor (ECF subfamily)